MNVTVPLDGGAVELDLPDDWRLPEETPDGAALVAVGPATSQPFRPNLVVTVDDVSALAGLRDWQQGSDYLMAERLHDYLLVDLERLPVAGGEGVRRLAHHAVDGVHSATMEQWAFVRGSQGVTLTATVGTMDYPALAPALRRIAQSLRVGGR